MSSDQVFEDGIVLNASPSIVLLKSDLDDILPKMFGRIIRPDAVWNEITACNDKASENLKQAPWIKRKSIDIHERILVWNLGPGESEVLSWSLRNHDDLAVIDDMAARKCSKSLKIRHIGTADLLVLAYRNGLIPSLEHAFSKVKNAGLFLSDQLVTDLIQSEKND
jgi:predicted nucleic acid-binding protein